MRNSAFKPSQSYDRPICQLPWGRREHIVAGIVRPPNFTIGVEIVIYFEDPKFPSFTPHCVSSTAVNQYCNRLFHGTLTPQWQFNRVERHPVSRAYGVRPKTRNHLSSILQGTGKGKKGKRKRGEKEGEHEGRRSEKKKKDPTFPV